MIVDDDINLIELISYNLKKVDQTLEIFTALEPLAALKILKEKRIDCIVSDFFLPGMNGIQFCKEVNYFLNIPFILYSGRESDDVIETSCIDDYVHKEPNLVHYTILAKKIKGVSEKIWK